MFIPYPVSPIPTPKPGALAPPPVMLADSIDPATGDARSFMVGDDPIDAAVQWQFTVRQNGGAAIGTTNGHRLHTITKATPQAPTQLADEARRVLDKFVTRGQLTNVSVESEIVGDNTATGAIEIRARNALADRAARPQRIEEGR